MKLRIEMLGLCYYAIVRNCKVGERVYNGMYGVLIDPSLGDANSEPKGGHDQSHQGDHTQGPENHRHVAHVFINKEHNPGPGDDDGDYVRHKISGYFDWLDAVADTPPRFDLPDFLTDMLASGCYKFDCRKLRIGGQISAIVPLNFNVCRPERAPVKFEYRNNAGSCDGGKKVDLAWKFVFEKTMPGNQIDVKIPGIPTPQTLHANSNGIVELRIKNTIDVQAHGKDPDKSDMSGDPKHFTALYRLLDKKDCNKPRECYPVADLITPQRFPVGNMYTCMGGGGGG